MAAQAEKLRPKRAKSFKDLMQPATPEKRSPLQKAVSDVVNLRDYRPTNDDLTIVERYKLIQVLKEDLERGKSTPAVLPETKEIPVVASPSPIVTDDRAALDRWLAECSPIGYTSLVRINGIRTVKLSDGSIIDAPKRVDKLGFGIPKNRLTPIAEEMSDWVGDNGIRERLITYPGIVTWVGKTQAEDPEAWKSAKKESLNRTEKSKVARQKKNRPALTENLFAHKAKLERVNTRPSLIAMLKDPEYPTLKGIEDPDLEKYRLEHEQTVAEWAAKQAGQHIPVREVSESKIRPWDPQIVEVYDGKKAYIVRKDAFDAEAHMRSNLDERKKVFKRQKKHDLTARKINVQNLQIVIDASSMNDGARLDEPIVLSNVPIDRLKAAIEILKGSTPVPPIEDVIPVRKIDPKEVMYQPIDWWAKKDDPKIMKIISDREFDLAIEQNASLEILAQVAAEQQVLKSVRSYLQEKQSVRVVALLPYHPSPVKDSTLVKESELIQDAEIISEEIVEYRKKSFAKLVNEESLRTMFAAAEEEDYPVPQLYELKVDRVRTVPKAISKKNWSKVSDFFWSPYDIGCDARWILEKYGMNDAQYVDMRGLVENHISHVESEIEGIRKLGRNERAHRARLLTKDAISIKMGRIYEMLNSNGHQEALSKDLEITHKWVADVYKEMRACKHNSSRRWGRKRSQEYYLKAVDKLGYLFKRKMRRFKQTGTWKYQLHQARLNKRNGYPISPFCKWVMEVHDETHGFLQAVTKKRRVTRDGILEWIYIDAPLPLGYRELWDHSKKMYPDVPPPRKKKRGWWKKFMEQKVEPYYYHRSIKERNLYNPVKKWMHQLNDYYNRIKLTGRFDQPPVSVGRASLPTNVTHFKRRKSIALTDEPPIKKVEIVSELTPELISKVLNSVDDIYSKIGMPISKKHKQMLIHGSEIDVDDLWTKVHLVHSLRREERLVGNL